MRMFLLLTGFSNYLDANTVSNVQYSIGLHNAHVVRGDREPDVAQIHKCVQHY
jgi:hypothetical protein